MSADQLSAEAVTPRVDPAGFVRAFTTVAGLRDVFALTKPRLSSLVLFTAGGGIWLTHREVSAGVAASAIIGTTLVVGGANALNCYLERDLDGRMDRTRNRPLPAGRLHPDVALAFGLLLSLFAVPFLTITTTPLAGLLAALALFVYVMVYTPLKQRSSISTLIGALPGALPPLIGWTAVTGRIEPGGLALFALLFAWQIPHSLAIGIYRQADYERAGMVVFPSEYGLEATRRQIMLYTLGLAPLPLVLVHLGAAGPVTAITGSMLGLVFIWRAWQGYRDEEGARWARQLFLYSLVYLTTLFVTLAVDKLL